MAGKHGWAIFSHRTVFERADVLFDLFFYRFTLLGSRVSGDSTTHLLHSRFTEI